jgi:hypothetical protein
MVLLKHFQVSLRPIASLNIQETQTYGSLYRRDINPGGPLLEGKTYDILAISERSGGDWSFLIANEYNGFNWVPMDLCRYVTTGVDAVKEEDPSTAKVKKSSK